eukprot:CAMPEP_0170524286 /NCGR_PEP_ID=MMETSP0209-20121228/9717_1 /TAXON_ID=665100 ORGANISM="Litonotus pictus, Strain P1" /NCGR_SAMPLE_ID=MMETSP0209 /ASSEMBLY_ACC=CAM_ASM_000301 /LENGTH=132 /DNA_ID=CAMNT_0010812865 /DNA_START=1004 /DNA_END=1399 /DNA_ORIENTATION=-
MENLGKNKHGLLEFAILDDMNESQAKSNSLETDNSSLKAFGKQELQSIKSINLESFSSPGYSLFNYSHPFTEATDNYSRKMSLNLDRELAEKYAQDIENPLEDLTKMVMDQGGFNRNFRFASFSQQRDLINL